MAIDLDRMTLPEIFQHISELPATKRSSALKAIADLTPHLKTLLRMTFNKSVVMDLPKGAPPFNKMDIPENMGLNRLPAEMRKLQYLFPGNNLSQLRRERMFIEILESISPEEAELLLAVKEKKLKYKGITRKLVEDTLPELFEGEEK